MIVSFVRPLFSCLDVLRQLVGYLLRLCWALLLPRVVTATQVLALQSQLAAEVNRSSAPRKRHHKFVPALGALCVMLSKFADGWDELVHVMKLQTGGRWAERGQDRVLPSRI